MLQTNCSRAFSPFPHKSAMPIDLAISIYQSKADFYFRRTPKSRKPRRASLTPSQTSEHLNPLTETKDKEALQKKNGKPKKQVSFADQKGLSLTKVKVFSQFHDPIDIPPNIQELLSSANTSADEEDKLELDFAQPSSDYLFFRQRLESNHVCLEHCMLKEKALAGTVKVKNLSFEKTVKVRVTFDMWRSYTDVGCQYVKDTYTGSDRDTFSFEFPLPDQVRSCDHIEFAIFYEANGLTYWDSNQDRNYKIIRSSLKRGGQGSSSSSPQRHSFDSGIHFDRYGSPRCSQGIFPEWPSYVGYEDIGPYY